jgi:hypothetical protein
MALPLKTGSLVVGAGRAKASGRLLSMMTISTSCKPWRPVGVAIANARLFEATRRQLEMAALRAIAARL